MLLLVLRHPTCVSYIAWICRCIHVPIYHLIVLDCTPSYTLCALTSHHRVRCSSGLKQLAKHHSQVTRTPCKAPQKAVEGATALFICLFVCLFVFVVLDDKREKLKTWHVLIRSFFGIRIRHASTFAVFSLELLVIQLHTLCLGLYFFAHSSRYNFLP